jgi:hypothetical protein
MADETNDSSENDGEASKPAKKPVASRKTTEPTNGGEANEKAGPGTGDMNWDKAKEAISDVDWDSRGYQLKRGGLMILAAIAAAISRSIIFAMATANFLYVFIMLERLTALSELSGRLSAYVNQLYDYIGYHSDEPVFPFAPFPEAAKRHRAD